MNRTDRMYAITEELRRVGARGATGARLAGLLEVSQRTVKRDVAALQQAGAPIWAQSGPGGGYALAGTASLPPVNFTPAQAVAVAIALAVLPAGSPFSADGTTARGKVLGALGPAERARAEELAGRVWVRVRADAADEQPAQPTVLRAVESTLADHRVLALTYRSESGVTTRRAVEPVLLASSHGRWYLIAWCRLRSDIRWFRLGRIERADATRETFAARDVAQVGQPPADAVPVST